MNEEEDKPTLLLVEDNPTERKIIQVLLERAGYDVHPVQGSDEAIEELNRRRFDIVVCDILFPGEAKGGLQLFQMLQPLRSPFHSGLDSVFILYTHYPDFKDCVQAIKAGAFDYLQKEASHRSLLQSCAAGLEEKRDWTDDADAAFVQNSWSDLVEKHGEKWIAVSGGRVIAVHGHLQGLYGQLREDYPQAKPYIIRLERESVLSV